ncbi:MAG: hypothetical protein U9O98_08735 [Asgard group archaeon]|nr:hypothetical protein [Asgard group archaeon]
MRRQNGAVIWLLLSGFVMGFALSVILGYMLALYSLIPVFLILVIGGYICARVIGKAGGELSVDAKSYSIILEGLVFGLTFELMRLRPDVFINIFKGIAIGSLYILMAIVLNRNLEQYQERKKVSTLELGIMRPSIMYIFAGFGFASTINALTQFFLGSSFFIVTLIVLIATGSVVAFTSKSEYDLLEKESGMWTQLFAGGTLGIAYDLIFFRITFIQDLIKLIAVCLLVGVLGFVVRIKDTETKVESEGIKLELAPKKSKKTQSRVAKEPSSRKKKSSSSSKYRTRKKSERTKKRKK